jgi:uncharacterized membrane protein YeaQ/YmgE (transglycosylase-associated protein family)
MDMNMIIQIIAGLVGGNAAGAGLKNLSLGTAGNSIVGAVGGLVSSFVAGKLGLSADAVANLDIGAIIQSVVAGGAGGAVLTAILGAVKKAVAK